ncbi:MAG TPA: hypothetical protein VFP68_07935 [Burkholderiaceae bacterium]|nr:hypothetical protein [Burkholderiaceae bacterium]
MTIGGLTTASLQFTLHGTPGTNRTASMGMELIEVGGSGRKLQLMIDKVNVTVTNGVVGAAIASDAMVYVYGHKSNGADISMSFPASQMAEPSISITDNTLNLHYDRILSNVLNTSFGQNLPTAQSFTAITGTFAMKIAVRGINVRHEDASALPLTTITVGTSGQSVTGSGFAGTLTIQ